MKTITGQINAYVTEHSGLGPEDFKSPAGDLINKLFYSHLNMTTEGWTLAGKATITVELVNTDELLANKVASLESRLKKHNADSQVVRMRYEDQISKLLAISYDGANV